MNKLAESKVKGEEMLVRMCDFAQEYRSLKPDIDKALQRVLQSGQPYWGPEVPAFETEFAELAGAKYAIGTNSGTAALRAALLALGIGPGDEVIAVPNAGIFATSPIHHVGAQAVWVDVEPDTLNMDPNLVEAAITPRTRAILPVHLCGHAADMSALQDIARRHGLFIVEDACVALGASIDGQPMGSWGEVTCFSFAPTKHLGAYGSGGIAVTQDADLAERLQLISGYGYPRQSAYDKSLASAGQCLLVEGLNERLDEMQAAILRVKLPHVAEWIEARQQHARAYTQALQGTPMRPPTERPVYRHTYRNYVIRVAERAYVQQELTEAGISSSRLYAPPLHLQPAYERLGYERGSFPVAEAASEALISLPVGPNVTVAQRDYIIETLLQICETL